MSTDYRISIPHDAHHRVSGPGEETVSLKPGQRVKVELAGKPALVIQPAFFGIREHQPRPPWPDCHVDQVILVSEQ